MANEAGTADRYLGYNTSNIWNDPNLTKYSGLKPMDQAAYMTPEARKSFANDLYKRLKSSNYNFTYSNPAGSAVGGAPKNYNAEAIYGLLTRGMEGRPLGSDVKDLQIFENVISKDPTFQRQLKESYTYFPAFYNALKSGNMSAYDKFVKQKALEGMSPTQRMAVTGAGIVKSPYTSSSTQSTNVPMYQTPAGPYLLSSATMPDTRSTGAVGGVGSSIGGGYSLGVPTGLPLAGAGAVNQFDVEASRKKAAEQLKKDYDAQIQARLDAEQALFGERLSPLERQMAGMSKQLATKEFQTMRQAFQNLANRGMLNSGQNLMVQNEAARATNEAMSAAQQAYLDKVMGLQDQYRRASQELLDKKESRDLGYFIDQLRRQEASKLDEIEKIRLQNEGRIAVANINAASRSQVANIRAEAQAVARSTSGSTAPKDVQTKYLDILQKSGKSEADYYYKRYKTAAEAFATYSKNAKQDPNVLQRLYDDLTSAKKEMDDRALATNTGVTSIAAQRGGFIP